MDIQVKKNVALKNLCTYHTGGSAMYLAEAANWQMIFALRDFARKQNIPYMIIGGGSNVLFSDENYPGLIILNRINRMQFRGQFMTAEGGVGLTQMILIAADQNLGGIAGLASVPGTVGGAIYGNAGIPDVYIGDRVVNVTILPVNGNYPVIVGPDYLKFGYRTSRLKETKDVVLAATLKLEPMPKAVTRAQVDRYIKERAIKQPAGFSCGSFFKNPGHFPSAGWLIDQTGCKGLCIGDAQVSDKHANFIINKGNATTRDILTLASMVHTRVKNKFDVSLEPEVQIVPYNPFNSK